MVKRNRNVLAKLLVLFVTVLCFFVFFVQFDNSINDLEELLTTRLDAVLEAGIKSDLQLQVPGLGDYGVSVNLSGDAAEQGEKDIALLSLNEELSKYLSYNRKPPDPRHKLCHEKEAYYIRRSNELPSASVIIVFHNEPYSVLLRTVHSVLNTVTSNTKLLREVILVDDGSTLIELKAKLDYYVRTRLPKKVKILRLPERSGLIKARLAGARLAKADVLMFLDAHCECVKYWLEPLLDRIDENPDAVVTPIIDVIDFKDFKYDGGDIEGGTFDVGGFTWDGHFDWHNVPEKEYERLKRYCPDKVPEICPTNSPTMAGGLFAIRRDYFWEIGSYDEQMDGWGGENLEMSFRIWMCGGTLETIPCSRIGHIFRDFHPYSFPDNRDTHGINTVRMALVWMDEYIDYFFMNRPDLKDHPDIGDITHRRMLREKLKCKSFDWYMQNVYPEKFVPTKNVRAYGRVASQSGHNICLDDLSQGSDDAYNLGVYTCYKPEITNSQLFALTKEGVFRTERSCATVPELNSPNRKLILMVPCHNTNDIDDRFEVTDDGQIRHISSGLCLDHSETKVQDFVYMTDCDSTLPEQRWEFQH